MDTDDTMGMDVSSALDSAGAGRLRSGPTSRQVSESPIQLKDGNLFLSEVNVPDVSVGPGGTVDVTTGVANGAQVVENTDLDNCNNGANGCSGGPTDPPYCYNLEVRPSWIEADPGLTGDTCIVHSAAIGATEQTQTWEFGAPTTLDSSPQNETLTFILTAPGSGQFGAYEETIVFEDGAQDRPGTGSKEVDVDTSGDGGGGGGSISQLQTVLVLTIVFILLLRFGGN